MSESDGNEKHKFRITWLILVPLLVIIVLLGGILVFDRSGFCPKLDSKITYYAVVLNNGLWFYGHPESVGKGSVVLTDVYYVVRQTDPQSKEVRNTLVARRKSEWHSPDKMIVNASNILLMEPVDPASAVPKLISEQKKGG
jgi:hypothetical protein